MLLHYLLTYLTTPQKRVLLEKLTDSQTVKKFSAFYGTRRFKNVITRACHLFLSWDISIQSMSQGPENLSSYCLPFYAWVFQVFTFPTEILDKTLLFPIRATCPSHFIFLDLITRLILFKEYSYLSSSNASLID
jgi:hypothetical protein